MTELQKLYDKKGKLIHQMRDLYEQAEKESRGLNEEEDQKFNAMDTDLKSLQERIDKGEEVRRLLNEHENHMNSVPEDVKENRDVFSSRDNEIKPTESREKVTYKEAWERYVTAGREGLTSEMRSVLNQGRVRGKEFRGQLDQVSSTDSLGGYLSPDAWANEVVESMKAYGGMLQAARIYPTNSGQTLYIPTEDTTSQLAVRGTQATAPAVADVEWGEITMSSHLYNSGIIKVSYELYAEDDAYNVLQRVQEIASKRMGRKLNLDLTDASVGDGSGNPRAILLDATNSGITAAAQAAVSRAELVDLIHSVDSAYRVGSQVGFMMSDATVASIKKLSFGNGDDRPLWVPSMREGTPDRIEGYQFYVNFDMPDMASGAKSILFGDFSKYWIRQVRGMMLHRSEERFWDENVIAYMMTARYDGRLVDTAAVKYFQNASA